MVNRKLHYGQPGQPISLYALRGMVVIGVSARTQVHAIIYAQMGKAVGQVGRLANVTQRNQLGFAQGLRLGDVTGGFMTSVWVGWMEWGEARPDGGHGDAATLVISPLSGRESDAHIVLARMLDDGILAEWGPHVLGARVLCDPPASMTVAEAEAEWPLAVRGTLEALADADCSDQLGLRVEGNDLIVSLPLPEPPTARPRLRIERADCPNSCSKCDEAWSLIATSEDGHEFEMGWIRTGNDDTESRGAAARIVEMWNSGREKP